MLALMLNRNSVSRTESGIKKKKLMNISFCETRRR
jgi:hypothetical protein